jgi:hypothetical protein
MPGLGSEALDFRAASESFAGVRKLARRNLETLRLVTDHQGRKVLTVGGMLRFGRDRPQRFPDARIRVDWSARTSARSCGFWSSESRAKRGYPPDEPEKATHTVLEQAELLSAEWAAA